MSRIAILGTGSMCKALGAGWSGAGHSIMVGAREPQRVDAETLGYEPAVVGSYTQVIEASDVVVLAVPFVAVVPLVTEHRQRLRRRLLIDISNPFDALDSNLRAGAELTADALGTREGLVAAFKDNFAATIHASSRAAANERPQVKIAGDDEAAKAAVATLAVDLDHRVLDCGSLHNARVIDSMVSLMLFLDERYTGFTMKTGWRFTGLDPQ